MLTYACIGDSDGGGGGGAFVCVYFLLSFDKLGKGERVMTMEGDEHRTEENIIKCAIFSNANAKFSSRIKARIII